MDGLTEREAAEGSHSVADVAPRSCGGGGDWAKRDGGRQSLDAGPRVRRPAGPRGHKLQPN